MTEHANLPRLRQISQAKREELQQLIRDIEMMEQDKCELIRECVCLEEVIKTLAEDDFMPFGRYHGMRLKDLPREYVQGFLRDYAINKDLRDKLIKLHSLEADYVTQ